MDIEQAIYTYVKVRYDTRTAGFGFYSLTAGMELLLSKSRELRALVSSYIPPRNSDIWLAAEETDPAVRDAEEERRITEHHPISFGYTIVNAGSRRLAVMTYGKNLGRDLAPVPQEGNCLVNTVVLESI